MEKKRKIAPETMAILELLAEGHSPRSVSEGCGVTISYAREVRRRYPDVIAALQGKHLDGSPLRFAPGHGTESIAKMQRTEAQTEPAQEEPAPEPEEPRRHSVAELFRKIDRLEGEKLKLMADCAQAKRERDEALDTAEMEVAKRKELENQLANANGKTAIDKGRLLCFLLNEIGGYTDPSDFDFIRGISYAIDHVVRETEEGVWRTVGSLKNNADAERTVPAELE